MMDPDVERVTIFDTTLRDGEQAPGFSMDGHAKVAMAHALADLGVDVIEAGFAAASPGDEEAIRRVAGEVEGPVICSLARATEHDIAAAARSIGPASRARIHTFVATSPIHREHKLKMTRAQVKEVAIRAVRSGPGRVRRRGVLRRGRHPHRAGVPGRGAAGRPPTPEPRRSTFPTRWATACRTRSRRCSPI